MIFPAGDIHVVNPIFIVLSRVQRFLATAACCARRGLLGAQETEECVWGRARRL